MPVYFLTEDEELFPPAEAADPSGLLAVGGDLSPTRILAAYRRGIFPWYSEGQPILWHSPDPRFVLEPKHLHIPRSLDKTLRKARYEVRFDTAFEEVIAKCQRVRRPDQDGTWITEDMRRAYAELFRLGHAHSVESWEGGQLQGGLYGVSLGSVFFGESMFSVSPDASKVAFVHLVRRLVDWSFTLVDCQVETVHLARFGAVHWPRARFLRVLRRALATFAAPGAWTQGEGTSS